MNKHKKGTKKEETGKAETKKKQFLKVGLSQKNENHKCEEYCIGKQWGDIEVSIYPSQKRKLNV